MEHPNESSADNFDQHTENELKRMKLTAEYGAVFGNASSGSEVSPETEGQFLDYIQQWEEQYALRKRILVYDLVGRPEWKSVDEMDDMQVAVELERIFEVLNSNSVVLDTLCEVEDRQLYRFVTEELFNVEVDDIRIEGMRHCFIYEDFHPNHPYDIKNRISEVIDHLMKRSTGETIPWGLDDNVSYLGNMLTKEDFNELLLRFRESFDSLVQEEFRFNVIELNEDQTEAIAICHLEFKVNRDGEVVEYAGECKFSLRCNYEWWLINEVGFGFNL